MVTFLTPLGVRIYAHKGSLGQYFYIGSSTEGTVKWSISPYFRREVSVLTELHLGHLRYALTDVPPQPNSPSAIVFRIACIAGQWPRHTTDWRVTQVGARNSVPPFPEAHPSRRPGVHRHGTLERNNPGARQSLLPGSRLSTLWNKPSDNTRGGISRSHCCSRLCYTKYIAQQTQTRVKLNRVFFPRFRCQDRSLGCGFAR